MGVIFCHSHRLGNWTVHVYWGGGVIERHLIILPAVPFTTSPYLPIPFILHQISIRSPNNYFVSCLEKYQAVDLCVSHPYPKKIGHWPGILHSILFFRALKVGRGEGKSKTRRFYMPSISVFLWLT